MNFYKGDINNLQNIEMDVENIYFTSGSNDSDYRLYFGDKLLAKCGSIDELEKKIPIKLSDLESDSENRLVTDFEKNRWNSYDGVVFSESEFIVGKWVDGRDIYRRTIIYEVDDLGTNVTTGKTEDGTVTSKTNHWAYTEVLSGANIDMFISMEGTAFCTSDKHINGVWQPIPRVCPDACENYSIGFGDFNTTTGKIGILFGVKYTTAKIYLTVEYVKKK